MTTASSTQPAVAYTNGIDQPEDQRTPIDQVVSYSLISSTHRLHFDNPIAFLNTVVLVLLMRLPARPNLNGQTDGSHHPRRNRVVLIGLKASFDAFDRLTTWGPDPLFWIELPSAMMDHPTCRSSPLSDHQLGFLSLALNRSAHRVSQRGVALSDGPLLPPTMIALPPEIDKPDPVVNSYVERMAEIFRVGVDEVWPILAEEMVIPSESTNVGASLIDARLWDHAHGESLGEYAYLGGSLGRAVHNPARRIDNIDFMEQDHILRTMRRSLPIDHAAGCTEHDLEVALQNPSYPLFLSKISKIGSFRLDRDDTDGGVIELVGQGQRVLLPRERTLSGQSNRRAAIPCKPAKSAD